MMNVTKKKKILVTAGIVLPLVIINFFIFRSKTNEPQKTYAETQKPAEVQTVAPPVESTEIFPGTIERGIIVSCEIEDSIAPDERLYDYVQQMPSFKGGEKALIEYIRSEIKYPGEAVKNRIEGTVILKFTVEKDGKISSVEAIKSPERLLSEEAIRVMKKSPDWNPGRQGGIEVRVNFTIPIKFELPEDTDLK